MAISKPLPERMRPDDVAQFLGQTHLTDRLRSLMQAKRLPSLLFFGPPGCGKSTLCKMVLRLHNPDMGDIVLDGKSYRDKKSYDAKQFKLEVQPIFQNPYESFSARKPVDSYLFNTALRLGIAKNKAEATNLVDDALKSVGLSLAVVKGKYPTQFSGGELQRVSIARALITRPKLIIADEPVAAIDASMKMNIVNLFKELKDKYKVSFIYITHDLGVVANVADRIAVMYAGDIVELGTCDEVFYDPRHPYTWALLSSLPQLGTKDEPLYSIQGTPPNLFHEVKGDAFAPRNPKALKIDFVERPPFFEVTPTHYARTWLMDPRAPKVEPPEHVRILREKGVNRVG